MARLHADETRAIQSRREAQRRYTKDHRRTRGQLTSAQNQRDSADEASLAAIKLVVNAVKGDPAEGDDGDLYETMGYKRSSERSSGLTRGKTATAKAA